MSKANWWRASIVIIILAFSLAGCANAWLAGSQAASETADTQESINRAGSQAAGQAEATHGAAAEPNYDLVFPQDKVSTLQITISPENWQAMQADLTAQLGEAGSVPDQGRMGPPGAGFPGDGNAPAQPGERPAGFDPAPANRQPPPGGGPGPGGNGGPVELVAETPVYVPSTVEFEGQTWDNVGIRFRGNSTLVSSWSSGTLKISFKLDFDQFEDEPDAIEDQTFYGFQELSLNSNAMDSSLLREKVVADIFRSAGVPAPNTAFYALYVDTGEGPQYFGLYTLIETVEDTLVETQFEDGSGNVYKPEGEGGSFAAGSFSETAFEKESNQDEADWSDIQAVFTALHSDLRQTDPQAWRANLEAVFNVDEFLRWLAVDTLIQNWDTYGTMGHNYYLYHDPTTGQLNWIPWDNNMALSSSSGRASTRELDLSAVSDSWPLISYLFDDEVYRAAYDRYVLETMNGAFSPQRMLDIYTTYHNLIQPYVTGANAEQPGYTHLQSAEAFDQSLDELIEHVKNRYTAASAYLESR